MDKIYKGYMTEISKMMPNFKRMVNAVVPNFAETIESRVKAVEITFDQVVGRRAFGKTERVVNGKSLKSTITIDPRLFTGGERQEYRKRETVMHEMLHATAGAVIGKWDYRHDEGGAEIMTEEPCVVFGNANIEYYRGDLSPESFYRAYIPQIMVEEGIVTDWSSDMVAQVFSNEFTATEPEYRRMAVNLQLPAVMCGCWNAVSNNQLRREFMTGRGEGRNDKTHEFKTMLEQLYKTLKYNGKASVGGIEELDREKIFSQYCALIDYFEENRPKILDENVSAKLNAYLDNLKTGEPLYNTLFFMCDKKCEAGVIDFMHDTEKRLKAMYERDKDKSQDSAHAR